nr:unnamed protein product [Digitaria exilis]
MAPNTYRGQVAGPEPGCDIGRALARLLPCRTFSSYTTRFVPMPLNAVLSRHWLLQSIVVPTCTKVVFA